MKKRKPIAMNGPASFPPTMPAITKKRIVKSIVTTCVMPHASLIFLIVGDGTGPPRACGGAKTFAR
jgi:hypothetical protein